MKIRSPPIMNMLNFFGYACICVSSDYQDQPLASACPSRHHDTFSSAHATFLVLPKPRAKIFDTTEFSMVGRRAMGLTGGTGSLGSDPTRP